VLDVRLPGESGLELQRKLAGRSSELPIVFITGHGDIPMSVKAMKAGAVEFLTKPFRERDLLAGIEQALARDRASRRARAELLVARSHLESLSPRERQVLELVVAGRLNKQIAFELGISEVTVKIHRRHAMIKMAADSVADLVRTWERLGIPVPPKPRDHTKV
jgi:FixJ family two-component response regulator